MSELKTLREHNGEVHAERSAMREDGHHGYAGVLCDECGWQMVFSDGMMLMSNPPQMNVKCLHCGYSGRKVKGL